MARLADAEVDRLTVDGAESLDRTARDDLYGRVQHDVLASAAVVPLYTPSSIMGVARRVDGIGVDPNAWPVFFDAWRVSG
jgi:peptide/nickel transport system substrate-binding protein